MASFVNVAEYMAYADISNVLQAEIDLDAACDEIRDYLNQTIDLVTGDVITLYGTDSRAMLLPELPIVAVTSVILAATVSSPAVAVTDYTVDQYGILWRDAPYFWPRGNKYTVTYSHGYAPVNVPSLLKVAAFKLARLGSTGGTVKQESTGPFSVTYESAESQDTILGNLERRIVKRVPVP